MGLTDINPISLAESWHVFTVQGVASPPCVVGEGKRKHEWDVKRGKGAQGGFVTYVGAAPMTFAVTVHLWDDGMRGDVYFPQLDHFAQWDAFLPLLRYDPTKKSVQAIDFYHPSFEGLGLHSVVTESISNLQHKGDGLYVVTVDFLEYVPPPKSSAVSSPTSSASGTGAGDGAKAPPGTVPDPAIKAAQDEYNKAKADADALGPL